MKRTEWVVSIADEGEVGVIESANWLHELVRCKDCEWFEMPRFGERGFCRHLDIVRDTLWYCSDGRRRND